MKTPSFSLIPSHQQFQSGTRLAPTLVGLLALSASVGLAAPVELTETEPMLKKMDSEIYLERNAAQEELGQWVKKANKSQLKELQEIAERADSPEVRERLRDVLKNYAYLAVPNTRGFIGIQMTPVKGGVMIGQVEEGQPADKAGLQIGDIVLELDDHDLAKMHGSVEEATNFLRDYVKQKKEGEKLELKIQRGDQLLHKELRLGNYDSYIQGLNNREFKAMPGGGLQLRIGPGAGAGRQLNIVPQQLDAKALAEIEKQMMELRKRHGGANVPKLELKNGELKLEFRFGGEAQPAQPAKPAQPKQKADPEPAKEPQQKQ